MMSYYTYVKEPTMGDLKVGELISCSGNRWMDEDDEDYIIHEIVKKPLDKAIFTLLGINGTVQLHVKEYDTRAPIGYYGYWRTL